MFAGLVLFGGRVEPSTANNPGIGTNGWVWLRWSYWELAGKHRVYYPDR